MTGRMIRQKVAVRIILLQPCSRIISSLRISAAALAVSPHALLVHIVRLVIQREERIRIISGARIFPFKLMDTVYNSLAVLIQDPDRRMIQPGHIPLETAGDKLVRVEPLHLQLFDLPHLCLQRNIECRIVLSVSFSVCPVIGSAEMIRQTEEIKFSVVLKGGQLGSRICAAQYRLIPERRAEHVVKRHIGRSRIFGLSCMCMIFSFHISSAVRSSIILYLHSREP